MNRYRWLAGLVVFLIISEGLYILSQKPIGYVRSAYKYHFKRFEESYSKGEYGLGLKHLQLGSGWKIYELNTIYPKIEMLSDELRASLWSAKLEDKGMVYQLTGEEQQLLEEEIDTLKLAKLLYKIGGQIDGSDTKLKLWLLAARLAPEWSYFHLEVANLYNEKNDRDSVGRALDFCLKFESPAKDCEEMKSALQSGKLAEPSGHYAQMIAEIE